MSGPSVPPPTHSINPESPVMAQIDVPMSPEQEGTVGNFPETLVTEDPASVRKVEDRGEDDYRKYSWGPAQTQPDEAPNGEEDQHSSDAVLSASRKLWRARHPFAPDPNIHFIPRAAFDEIMTRRMVLQIVQQLDCYINENSLLESTAADIYSSCRRLLAALISTRNNDKPWHRINILIGEGMSDRCLPYLVAKVSAGPLICELSGHEHKSINAIGEDPERFRDDFATWIQTLLPPFIVYEPKKPHCHYILRGGGPLPTKWISETESKPLEGGFGDVQKVYIDPGDRYFDLPKEEDNCDFALKKLQHKSANRELSLKEFDLEVRTLIFAESRIEKNCDPGDTETKRHLIQLLATFKVCNGPSRLPTYYLLFPWADGTLQDLWNQENGQHQATDKLQLGFIVEEFYHLSKALQCVHNDRQRIAHITRTKSRRYGRHGDITPQNLLFFRGIGNPKAVQDERKTWKSVRIVLSDFGLGRLNSEVSKSNADPKVPYTISYAAPEYEIGQPLSRRADIFSLGCVFLLHIVWLFDGVDGLNEFSEERKSETDIGFEDFKLDTFWKKTGKGSAVPVIKDSVKKKFKDLKDRDDCVEVVGEILTLIEKAMIRANKNHRLQAGKVVEELGKIQRKWKRADSLYATRAWKDSTLSRASTFDQFVGSSPIDDGKQIPQGVLTRAETISPNDAINGTDSRTDSNISGYTTSIQADAGSGTREVNGADWTMNSDIAESITSESAPQPIRFETVSTINDGSELVTQSDIAVTTITGASQPEIIPHIPAINSNDLGTIPEIAISTPPQPISGLSRDPKDDRDGEQYTKTEQMQSGRPNPTPSTTRNEQRTVQDESTSRNWCWSKLCQC